jgi:hypothetical protein
MKISRARKAIVRTAALLTASTSPCVKSSEGMAFFSQWRACIKKFTTRKDCIVYDYLTLALNTGDVRDEISNSSSSREWTVLLLLDVVDRAASRVSNSE